MSCKSVVVDDDGGIVAVAGRAEEGREELWVVVDEDDPKGEEIEDEDGAGAGEEAEKHCVVMADRAVDWAFEDGVEDEEEEVDAIGGTIAVWQQTSAGITILPPAPEPVGLAPPDPDADADPGRCVCILVLRTSNGVINKLVETAPVTAATALAPRGPTSGGCDDACESEEGHFSTTRSCWSSSMVNEARGGE